MGVSKEEALPSSAPEQLPRPHEGSVLYANLGDNQAGQPEAPTNYLQADWPRPVVSTSTARDATKGCG